MNEIYRPQKLPPTTQAAEGLPRRRWTTAELEAAAAHGLFRDARGNDERFELIGGEVVPMSPKGNRHEIVRNEVSFMLTRQCTSDLRVTYEPQFNLSADTYAHPDILLHPAHLLIPDVRGPDALLVIEVAETSLRYDTVTKAALYASFGVREYWVIHAMTLETRVFSIPTATGPTASGYSEPRIVDANTELRPMLCPALAVTLGTLRLS